MAEGAGLENRYALTGIVGSNPTLSVKPGSREERGAKRKCLSSSLFAIRYSLSLLHSSMLALQAITPADCVLTGLCGIRDAVVGPPSGLLFLALGVVIAGGIGWSRARRRG